MSPTLGISSLAATSPRIIAAVKSRAEISAALAQCAQTPPLARLLQTLGAEANAHLVGGMVRDIAQGLPATDIDIAVVLHPEEVIAKLREAGIHVVETGIEHGTVLAVVDETHIEITTFRVPAKREETHTMGLYSKTIEEDLEGRDFTINAIAFSTATLTIVDPFQGMEDLAAGRLKAVKDPARRFDEDPLRIMRLIRFGPAAGRTIDPSTLHAAQARIEKTRNVSIERIRAELEKILLEEFPADGIRAFHELGLLEIFIPEALPSVGFEQNEFHVHDVFEHTLSVIERTPRDLTLRLSALFHDLGKPHTLSVDDNGRRHFYEHEVVSDGICREVMSRMRFPHALIEATACIVRLHMRPVTCGPAGVRRLIRDLDQEFDRWRLFKLADATPTQDPNATDTQLQAFDELVHSEKTRVKGSVYAALAVDGHDLIAMGMRPGPEMGALLKTLHELVLDDPELNEKDVLLEKARALINRGR